MSKAIVSLILIMAFFAGPDASAKDYSNDDFKFSATLPDQFMVCPGDGGPDHGPILALATPAAGRCNDNMKRSMEIFAFYNVTDDMRTLRGLRAFVCEIGPEAPCNTSKLKLAIAALPSVVLSKLAKDGGIHLHVAAQNRTGPILSCATGINIIASLNTDAEHYTADLTEFKHFLTSVKIEPAPTAKC